MQKICKKNGICLHMSFFFCNFAAKLGNMANDPINEPYGEADRMSKTNKEIVND